ncbi:hypothetical protein FIBSPDRAFT_856731 [Athelia psychrophila]|uniref:Uncharacterized protein n=1 Tax=Athelia psychrophila TaxID=1759441 RepID=A0A166N1D9_9AGAM|nr:hypothetical protein FIBSPDRAFT_856731 [Fibularhizoctonia sp. CBS 109695]
MSSASITAIAVLESPRLVGKSKAVVFDAQIYQGAQAPLVAALRYFNGTDMTFEDVGTFFLHANVSVA